MTIPHGHYVDWFEPFKRSEAIPGRIGYVGLIRRYKGVEDLVSAFTQWNEPTATLHVAGKPSSNELVDALREASRSDTRVSVDARFLPESELVQSITAAELIVLPYQHMHNSGTALAALSLERPVLVPDNDVNRALAEEVGAGWVHLFTGSLSAQDIADAWISSRSRSGLPDLSQRDWPTSADAHIEAFTRARQRRLR